MVNLSTRYEAIDQDLSQLLKINEWRTDESLARTKEQRAHALTLSAALGCLGVLVSLGLLGWASRFDAMRQNMALLQERNRDLNAFAGRLAHDLRGPLATMSLSAGRIARKASVEDQSSVATLQRSIERMETLIRDLLALSRVGFQSPRASADAVEVAKEVESELTQEVKGLGGELRSVVEPGLVSKMVTGHRRRQVQHPDGVREQRDPNQLELFTVSAFYFC
jgi:signal transduction histidine kinase